ncbi:MAG: hypothetical protein WD883_02250 [Candidatus Colwellbacteria bacterium]
MQISQTLPQFEDAKALLIVTSQQGALFYSAHKGQLEKLDEFQIPSITYSDNEGHSQKHKGGILMGSGFVREEQKKTMRHKFLGQLDEYLNNISKRHQSIERIYVFAPAYVLLSVKGAIPYPLREKRITTIAGDYHQQHPFKLLEKIQKTKGTGSVKLMKESARKILDKAKQARKVIGR